MKTCSKCGEVKPVDAFPTKGRQCKACINTRQRRYRQSEQGKEAKRRHEQSDAFKDAQRRYRYSGAGAIDTERRRLRRNGIDPAQHPELVTACTALLLVKRKIKQSKPKNEQSC